MNPEIRLLVVFDVADESSVAFEGFLDFASNELFGLNVAFVCVCFWRIVVNIVVTCGSFIDIISIVAFIMIAVNIIAVVVIRIIKYIIHISDIMIGIIVI